MRVLTTAIDKGEHKVPEGHKVTLYALAPGDAVIVDGEERGTLVRVDAAAAKRAKYAYGLSWIDGRTVAEFTLDDKVVGQPIRPDPVQRSKRGRDHEDERSLEAPPTAPAAPQRSRRHGQAGVADSDPAVEGPGVAAERTRQAGHAVRGPRAAAGRRGTVPEVPEAEGQEAAPLKRSKSPRKAGPIEWL